MRSSPRWISRGDNTDVLNGEQIKDQMARRETLELVDRAYILHDGKVLMSGQPDDVIENENVRRVYLGDSFRIS